MFLSTNVNSCPNKLALAARILNRVSQGMDVFDSSVRQEQTIGVLELCCPRGGTFDDLSEVGSVLGMDALHDYIDRQFNRRFVLEDAISLV